MWLKLVVNLFGFVDLRWAVQDPVPQLLCSVKSDETQSNCRTDSNLLFSDFPYFLTCARISHIFNTYFSHFQLGFPTFSTQISHILDPDFSHFQHRFAIVAPFSLWSSSFCQIVNSYLHLNISQIFRSKFHILSICIHHKIHTKAPSYLSDCAFWRAN